MSKTETKDEAQTPATNEGVMRLEHAEQIVDKYAMMAGAAGLVPAPVVNWGGVLAVQVFMVSDISQKVYGQDFSKERIRSLVIALVASIFQKEVGHRAGRALGMFIPVIGPIAGLLATPAIAYATTRAVGRVFTAHFEAGGNLLTFDPARVQDKFKAEYQNSKEEAPAAA